MSVIVLLESNSGKISQSSKIALTAAKAISSDVSAILLGDASDVATLGVAIVYKASGSFDTAGVYAKAVADILRNINFTHVVVAATSQGKDVAPRVARLIGAAQVSDIVQVVSGNTYVRPMYAGELLATVEVSSVKTVVTVRTSAFSADVTQGSPAIETVTVGNYQEAAKVVSFDKSDSGRPELATAKIVVSGGRALKSAENFKALLEPLADKLGAGIGASRAAVDSGYAPNDWQVGQTGKIVAPNLYIAVGISGAIQHIAGMKDSKTIVAINNDGDAPIFEVADYGLVADLNTAIPELVKLL